MTPSTPPPPASSRRPRPSVPEASYRTRLLLGLAGSLLLVLGAVRIPVETVSDRVGWRAGTAYNPITVSDRTQKEDPLQTEKSSSTAPPATEHSEPKPAVTVSTDDPPEDTAAPETTTSGSRDRTIARMATLDPSEQPEIRGGLGALYMNIEYPEAAIKQGIEGRVVLHFLLDRDGTPTRIQVAESLHPLCDSAAVRGLRSVRFAPAHRDGTPVAVHMKLPVRFRLLGVSLSDGTAPGTGPNRE